MSAELIEPWRPGDRALVTLLRRGRTRSLTTDDLDELATEDLRVELLDGRLFVSPDPDLDHQDLVGELYLALRAVVPAGLKVAPGGNVYGGNTLVQPDVLVYDPTKAVRHGQGVSPDGLALVVEITSPSNRMTDLVDKLELYSRWGVPYLLVDRATSPYAYRVFGDWPAWGASILPS